jgi:AsmA protein
VTAEFAEVAGSPWRFSSLWSDRLRIKQIALDRPVIVLDATAPGDATPAPRGGDETSSGDPLPALVAFLERSAIESVSITSGTFVRRSAANPEEVVADVELTLTAPDIDDAFSLSASARMGGAELRDELHHLDPAVAARAPARRCHPCRSKRIPLPRRA